MTMPSTEQRARRYTTLVKPCKGCPFRRDAPPQVVSPERADEIADVLWDGGDFSCHKTVDYDDDADGDATPDSKMCAGAAIAQALSGARPSTYKRLIGVDPSDLIDDDSAEAVFDLDGWVAHQNPDDDNLDVCGVVARGCDNPAGFLMTSGRIRNGVPSTPVDQTCWICGSVACDNCMGDDGTCVDCDGSEGW